MSRLRDRRRGVFAALALALVFAACGKKGPLRLSADRPAEDAPALHARVRESSVLLSFKVPEPRFFPERQEKWVLARILRQTGGSAEFFEAGTILEPRGFAYGTPLSWTDRERPPKSALVYRVEYRDAERRRRALTKPLRVAWDRVPLAPAALTADGAARVVSLVWDEPGDAAGVRYRVYRRAPPQPDLKPLFPEPVSGGRFVDARTEPDREYCYTVRGVIVAQGLEVEGPASPEACARATDEELPPRQPPATDD